MFDNEIANIKRSIYQEIYPFLANNKTFAESQRVVPGPVGPQSARKPGLRVSATPGPRFRIDMVFIQYPLVI